MVSGQGRAAERQLVIAISTLAIESNLSRRVLVVRSYRSKFVCLKVIDYFGNCLWWVAFGFCKRIG